MAVCKSCSAEWLISGTLRFLSSLRRNFVGRSAGVASLKPAIALLRHKSRGCYFTAPLGILGLVQKCYTVQSRGGSPPQKEGEMCFWKQRSLLISCCSSWHPFAGRLDLALHLAQASVPGLGAQASLISSCFCVCLLISALLLLFSSLHLCQQPPEQPSPLWVQMSPSSSASLGCLVPIWCRSVRWNTALSHTFTFPRVRSSDSLCDYSWSV